MTKKQVIVFTAIAVAGGILFAVANVDGRSDDERRAACVKAIMTGLGASTSSYQDKRAYDAHVAKECEGFDLR